MARIMDLSGAGATTCVSGVKIVGVQDPENFNLPITGEQFRKSLMAKYRDLSTRLSQVDGEYLTKAIDKVSSSTSLPSSNVEQIGYSSNLPSSAKSSPYASV